MESRLRAVRLPMWARWVLAIALAVAMLAAIVIALNRASPNVALLKPLRKPKPTL